VCRNEQQREAAYHELRDKYLSCLQELVTSREGLCPVVYILQVDGVEIVIWVLRWS